MFQSANSEQGMVNCAQRITRNHTGFAAQPGDQIHYEEVLAERHQHSSNTFDEQTLATASHVFDSPQNVWQTDCATVFSGRY